MLLTRRRKLSNFKKKKKKRNLNYQVERFLFTGEGKFQRESDLTMVSGLRVNRPRQRAHSPLTSPEPSAVRPRLPGGPAPANSGAGLRLIPLTQQNRNSRAGQSRSCLRAYLLDRGVSSPPGKPPSSSLPGHLIPHDRFHSGLF